MRRRYAPPKAGRQCRKISSRVAHSSTRRTRTGWRWGIDFEDSMARTRGLLELERVEPAQSREARKIGVRGHQLCLVFDGECRQMRVRCQVPGGSQTVQQTKQN